MQRHTGTITISMHALEQVKRPTLTYEKCAECHGVMLAKETVPRSMREAGLWTSRK